MSKLTEVIFNNDDPYYPKMFVNGGGFFNYRYMIGKKQFIISYFVWDGVVYFHAKNIANCLRMVWKPEDFREIVKSDNRALLSRSPYFDNTYTNSDGIEKLFPVNVNIVNTDGLREFILSRKRTTIQKKDEEFVKGFFDNLRAFNIWLMKVEKVNLSGVEQLCYEDVVKNIVSNDIEDNIEALSTRSEIKRSVDLDVTDTELACESINEQGYHTMYGFLEGAIMGLKEMGLKEFNISIKF